MDEAPDVVVSPAGMVTYGRGPWLESFSYACPGQLMSAPGTLRRPAMLSRRFRHRTRALSRRVAESLMQEIDSLAKFGRNHLEWHLRVTGSRIPGSRLGKSWRQFVADLPVQAQECSDAFQRMLGVGYHVLVPDSHRCPGVGSFECQQLLSGRGPVCGGSCDAVAWVALSVYRDIAEPARLQGCAVMAAEITSCRPGAPTAPSATPRPRHPGGCTGRPGTLPPPWTRFTGHAGATCRARRAASGSGSSVTRQASSRPLPPGSSPRR